MSFKVFCLAFALLWSLALAALPAAAAPRPTQRGNAKVHSSLVSDLSRVAGSLETGLRERDVKVAEALFGLETEAVALLEQVARTRYTHPAVKLRALGDVRSLINRTLDLQERVLDHAIAELDRALPGEPERELTSRRGRDHYRPLYRSDTPGAANRANDARILRDMREAFVQEGGSLEDIKTLDAVVLAELKSGVLYEWAQVGKTLRLTSAGAKHPVIADGEDVRGAGSLKLYKAPDGEVILAVVSNASGNYKPGLGSTDGAVRRLIELGVAAQSVLTTSVQPTESTLIKLLLKSKTVHSKTYIKRYVAAVEARVARRTAKNRALRRLGPDARFAAAPRPKSKAHPRSALRPAPARVPSRARSAPRRARR